MDKFNKMQLMQLWDLYGVLLTDTQREIADMYFNLDLTISEIAEQKGVSRQSVSDCIKVCKSELIAYEQKLEFFRRLTERNIIAAGVVGGVKNWAEGFLNNHPECKAEFAELDDILAQTREGMNEIQIYFDPGQKDKYFALPKKG